MPIPVVVIPIYKKDLSFEEEASLRQCAKILNKYNISFVCAPDLDCSKYIDILSSYDISYDFVYFKKENFNGIKEYSRLMLTKEFYIQFSSYSHMLIYQLDAWVFKDELEYWCNKPFDYIGAPWFVGYDSATKDSDFLPKAGNGGFSLRNIPKMLETIDRYEKIYKTKKLKPINKVYKKEGYLNVLKHFFKVYKLYNSYDNTLESIVFNYNEDYIISKYFEEFNKKFVVASANDAISFSFELFPDVLYKKNNNELPFGCHAFKKYDWDFWKNYINI